MIQQVVELIDQMNEEELKKEQQEEQMRADQVKDLLEGIDFDEAIECCHTPNNEFVQKKQEMTNEEFKALLDDIDFDEPVTESTVTPILAPFSSNEVKDKSPMCHTISSTSITSSEPFDVSDRYPLTHIAEPISDDDTPSFKIEHLLDEIVDQVTIF